MLKRTMTDNAQHFIKEHLQTTPRKDLLAVDATMGNGFDLEFLAGLPAVSEIIGFDIQEEAVRVSRERTKNCQKSITYIQDSHHHMDKYVKRIDVAMFNLGYLPTGNKKVVTRSDTSVAAIKTAVSLLADEGIITIMTYPGHEEGSREHQMVHDYLSKLYEQKLQVFNLSCINTLKPCPSLYSIIKKI